MSDLKEPVLRIKERDYSEMFGDFTLNDFIVQIRLK